MTTKDIKAQLTKQLPEFDIIGQGDALAEDVQKATGYELQENDVYIHRDGQGLLYDFSKVKTKKNVEGLVESVKRQWERVDG